MKKVIFVLVAIFLIVIGIVVTRNVKSNTVSLANEKSTIKIGVTLPLSGDFAHVGKPSQKAIEMAFQEWKNRDTKYNYELIYEDNMFQPKQAALVTNKFINQDKVNAILSMWGNVSYIIGDAADKRGVIFLTCSGGGQVAKPYYVFNNYTQLEDMAAVVVNKFKKEGIKKVAYVVNMSIVAEDQIEIIGGALKEAGIEVYPVRFSQGTKDFRMAIAKTVNLNPDYYLLFLPDRPDATLFIKQYYDITGKNNLTSIDTFHEMPSSDWALTDGLWFFKSA